VSARRPRVLIVQERLRSIASRSSSSCDSRLTSDGIDLVLVHGRGESAMASRGDEAELPGRES